MKNVFAFLLLWACLLAACSGSRSDSGSDYGSSSGSSYGSSSGSSDSDIDKIIEAQAIVRSMVNFPDTLSFHDMSTRVNGNTVTLKFSAENAFGVSETRTMDIKVR